eukprot:TRINITY_DN10468_c0_g1_i1.p1 TRINITY_DN10468_c0_g1~~TRINITY_DN10468_c0_g1_i1.p1  ORF type:complete len:119 (-),score=25.66 TRINITY_DN10468_c0_g1_i1:225-542(-)
MSESDIILKTIHFVKEELAGNDASHDWSHIERVWKTAKTIAKNENVVDTEVVELGALLHDIRDWKYSGSEDAGENAAREFLTKQGYDQTKIERICKIIRQVFLQE